MADSGRPSDHKHPRSPTKSSKVIRSQKIAAVSPPTDSSEGHFHSHSHSSSQRRNQLAELGDKRGLGRNSSDESVERGTLPRSHTPGQLASKSSHERRRKPSDVSSSARQRSQSASLAPTQVPARPATSTGHAPSSSSSHPPLSNGGVDTYRDRNGAGGERRLQAMRSTSAIVSRPDTSSSGVASNPARKAKDHLVSAPKTKYSAFPPIQDAADAPDVPPAPASGMYWSKALVSGAPHTALRAHTTTLIGSNIYVFGGCDATACFNSLYVLDADSFHWSVPHMVGDIPMPLRAMTCTAVGKKLIVFGGGDGPAYYNDVYVLDTSNFRWTKPRIYGDKLPSKRRAHTACLYKNGIYVFGGGDGVRALNDIWRLDVSDTSKMSWKLISSADMAGTGTKDYRPKARGYHTANMVGSKLIIFGGSDGGECFDDVWVYDVEAQFWKGVKIDVAYPRLSHTATIVGSYLFVIGGHDGGEYSSDVLLLNLVNMTWDKRRAYGIPPSGRGYHGTVLHDSRLVVIGGFDGREVFGDVSLLELAVHAYYSQISHFTIDV